MLYCQEIRDGKIINFTQDKDIAKSLGWINEVDEQDTQKAYDGQIYLKGYAPEKSVEELQDEVRVVRNSYLEKYVDPKQLILVWDNLSENDKKLYTDYRIYLLDYTKEENWYLQNPKTLEEWKNSAKPVEELEEIVTKSTILE